MKTGLALIAGLLITDGLAGGSSLSVGGCNLSHSSTGSSFGCDCSGGSGSYSWNYSSLPSGWTSQGNRVNIPKGNYQDNRVYGAQVEVRHQKTNQSAKKSLYFSIKNGQVNRIAEHYGDFNTQALIPGKFNHDKNNNNNYQDYDQHTKEVRTVFDNADGIGRGYGLDQIIHTMLVVDFIEEMTIIPSLGASLKTGTFIIISKQVHLEELET